MDDKLIIKMYTEIFLTSIRSSAVSWDNSLILMGDMTRSWERLNPGIAAGREEVAVIEEMCGNAREICKKVFDRSVEYMQYYTTPREPSSYLPMIEEMRDLNEEMIEAGSKVRDRYQKLSVAFFNTDFRPEV